MGSDAFDDQSEASGRWARLDTGEYLAWMLLTDVGSMRPVADVWVYNLIPPIPRDEVQRYARTAPPPACVGFAAVNAVRTAHPDEVRFHWSHDGNAAAVEIQGQVFAFIAAVPPKGWSRNVLRDGPFGFPWDEGEYAKRLSHL
jgi:hypothetical protein